MLPCRQAGILRAGLRCYLPGHANRDAGEIRGTLIFCIRIRIRILFFSAAP
jgi:hypothetical protein